MVRSTKLIRYWQYIHNIQELAKREGVKRSIRTIRQDVAKVTQKRHNQSTKFEAMKQAIFDAKIDVDRKVAQDKFDKEFGYPFGQSP